MFKGSITALITPFKNDKLDEENYINLIHHHLNNGTHGLVPGGTTGESPTLSHEEHHKIINLSVKECKNKIIIFSS
jgi:4-hydroxy-tetrahydrodipicolinate synthase